MGKFEKGKGLSGSTFSGPQPEPSEAWTAPPEGVPDDLVQARAAVAEAIRKARIEHPGRYDNLRGVAIGATDSARPLSGDNASLCLLVADSMSDEKVRSWLTRLLGDALNGIPLSVRVVGDLHTFQNAHQQRSRPAPLGVSVSRTGPAAVPVGTLGMLGVGRGGERAEWLLMVSCNHVLANCNMSQQWDPIVQPGMGEDGPSGDPIAFLEQAVRLDFRPGSVNYVDAATARCLPEDWVSSWVLNTTVNPPNLLQLGDRVIPPAAMPGQVVAKSGRTTGLSRGTVTAIMAHVEVTTPVGNAWFDHQIFVSSTFGTLFAAPGDSGACVVTAEGLYPVGMCISGNVTTGVCVVTPMQAIQDSVLDFSLVRDWNPPVSDASLGAAQRQVPPA